MRLHLKQQPPDVHGVISEHKASHGHKSKEDTVTCLIREAMRRYDETDKIADLTTLVNKYMADNEYLKTQLGEARQDLRILAQSLKKVA